MLGDETIEDLPIAQVVTETIAFLANEYSGPEHEELWGRVCALLQEFERLRHKVGYEDVREGVGAKKVDVFVKDSIEKCAEELADDEWGISSPSGYQ